MDEERKERECFKFEDLEDNYEEIDSGDENDEMHVGANAEDVGDIIAGNANIHFYEFKSLMEHGHLKKEDLTMMRNARLVQVPGKGEAVVQFLASSKRDFNKINLKELGLNDVGGAKSLFGRSGFVLAQAQLPSLISEMISKKATTFRCNTCQTIHADVASVQSHININHADMLARLSEMTGRKAVNRAILRLLQRMCDPSLVIEEVVITNGSLKKARHMDSAKNHQINIYQRSADLLATLIRTVRSFGPRKSKKMYHCKSCYVNTLYSWKRIDRWGYIRHLAHTHWTEYQDFATQLNVAPGPRLDNLLYKALMPGLIKIAKRPQ